jgi:uncharacterized protein
MSESNTLRVATVWRYPVKSMQGEELNTSNIVLQGVVGDRRYALIDVDTGKVVSAKNPKKWPDLFACRAYYPGPPSVDSRAPVCIVLADGSQVRSDDPRVAAQVSKVLGRTVMLQEQAPANANLEQYWPEHEGQSGEVTDEAVAAAAAPGSFFDYAPVHLLTTGTLNQLRRLYPQGRFEIRRFRPNLVIDTGTLEGFVENAWVGKTVQIGSDLRLEVTTPCPRCVMTTLAQGDLPKDTGIFTHGITQNNVPVPFAGKALPSAGVYARVLTPGVATRGAVLRID